MDSTDAGRRHWCKFDPSVLDFRQAQNSTVLYSCLFACILFLTIIRFVQRARRRALVTGDESAAIAVILPSYLPILWAGIAMNLFRATVVVLYGGICNSAYIEQYPERSGENYWNNVLFAAYMLGFEWFANGFTFLFCERCVSYHAFVSSVTKGFLLSSMTTALYVVGVNYSIAGPRQISRSNFYSILQLIALGLPLFLVLIPLLITQRFRASAMPFVLYSVIWRVIYIVTVSFTWISYHYHNNDNTWRTLDDPPKQPVSNHEFVPPWMLVVMLFFRDILSPFFVYLALLRDTHYWRGLPQRRVISEYYAKSSSAVLTVTNSNINVGDDSKCPLLSDDGTAPAPSTLTPLSGMRSFSSPVPSAEQGASLSTKYGENVTTWLAQPRYPPGDVATKRLQNLLDKVPVQVYIDFAFLQIDFSRLLGRGATASVFVGMLTLKNSTVRALRSPSILSDPVLDSPNVGVVDTELGDETKPWGGDIRVRSASLNITPQTQFTAPSSLAVVVPPNEVTTAPNDSGTTVEDKDEASKSGDSKFGSFASVFSTGARRAEVAATSFIRRLIPSILQDESDEGDENSAVDGSSSSRAGDDEDSAQDSVAVAVRPTTPKNNSRKKLEMQLEALERAQNVDPKARAGFGTKIGLVNGRKVPVAVKMYTPPELDVPTIEAYAKETEILTELSHPNIVPYYGLCVNPPHLCLVFSLCKHGSLEEYLVESVRWSVERRVSVVTDCVRALAYVHKMGYVHRDIKPGNFLVDENYRCMLTDFGTCIRLPAGKSFCKTDSIAGTVDHMAPEVLVQTRRNMYYGYPSDVYSIGVVIASVLCMEMPYQNLGAFEIRQRVMKGQRPQLPACPPQLRLALLSSWNHDPLERISCARLLHILSNTRLPAEAGLFSTL